MIEIEVIESPDIISIGPRNFFFNTILIGKDSGDVLINEEQILDPHLTIEIRPDINLSYQSPDVPFYHLNNKRVSGPQKIKKNDVIKIENSVLKIINLTYENYNTQEETDIFNKKLLEVKDKDPELFKVYEIIKEIINEEKLS